MWALWMCSSTLLIIIECRALSIEYRALLIEYRALLMGCGLCGCAAAHSGYL